jgi:hypothetical protein
MSTIFVALILIAVVTSISLALVTISNRQRKKKTEKLLNWFSELGTLNNLSFTSQELLHNSIIGLDGLNKKLLILENHSEEHSWCVINLEEVETCNVKRLYQTTNAGSLKKPVMEEHLQKIVLRFGMKDGKTTTDVPFFAFSGNHITEIADLEQKAKHWETILCKMIPGKIKRTA